MIFTRFDIDNGIPRPLPVEDESNVERSRLKEVVDISKVIGSTVLGLVITAGMFVQSKSNEGLDDSY